MSQTELLRAFTESRSDAAFAQLVRRYAGLVYSVAKRRLANASLAEDITQLVFIRLAKTPPKVQNHAELAAWLHRTTANVTIDTLRSETRRRHREQQATAMEPATPENAVWEDIAPNLDDALNQLNDEDRQALLLRFFGQKAMREVGAALGVREDAAKMRVSRALDRLRTHLGVGGVSCTAALLGTVLMERSVEAVPGQLLSRLAAIRLPAAAGAAGVGGVFDTLLQISKFKLAVGAVVLAVIGVSTVHPIRSLNAPPAEAVMVNSETKLTSVTALTAAGIANREQFDSGSLKLPLMPPVADTNAGGESFTGGVIDKFNHAPVAGAIVHVRREISSSTEHRTVEETEHVTDADGHFQFNLTPDLVTNGFTYLNFEVTHSNYARMPWDGYALGMIRKNQALGARPFFEQLELTPGEGLSGALVRPDGSPAVGVKILTFSKASQNDMAEYGSFAEARTDTSGHFNVNVVKGGEAVLWLLPQDLAPATHLLHQQRGDLGQFKLEDGTRITGRVLANDGSPVNSVWVNAELTGGPAKKRIGMPVADAMTRSALTDQQGRFTMGPLPAGDYDLLLSETSRDSVAEDRSTHPLPDVFLHQKLHLDSDPAAVAVEIHAVPHVLVAIQQLDSQGKPHKTHAVQVSGQFEGTAWWGQGIPDETGNIAMKVPRGLTDAQITLMVNEHQATRSRWSSDSPWSNEHRITAPVLDHDYRDVSVIYYSSPVLLVRATAEDGSPISGFTCRLEYSQDRKPDARPPHWIDGVAGDVNFEKQSDGRWRSEQLLPDENVQLTVQADGFKAYTRTVNLPEGTTREVEATLQKL